MEKLTNNFRRFKSFIKKLSDKHKMKNLQDSNYIKKHKYEIERCILSLSENNKNIILLNKELMEEQLGLLDYDIVEIISSIENEDTKSSLIDLYELERYYIIDILKTFSDESKRDILLYGKKYHLTKNEAINLISSMDNNFIIDFFKDKDSKTFLSINKIKPYKIVEKLHMNQQLDFIHKFEDIGLSLRRKKKNSSSFKTGNKKKDE